MSNAPEPVRRAADATATWWPAALGLLVNGLVAAGLLSADDLAALDPVWVIGIGAVSFAIVQAGVLVYRAARMACEHLRAHGLPVQVIPYEPTPAPAPARPEDWAKVVRAAVRAELDERASGLNGQG